MQDHVLQQLVVVVAALAVLQLVAQVPIVAQVPDDLSAVTSFRVTIRTPCSHFARQPAFVIPGRPARTLIILPRSPNLSRCAAHTGLLGHAQDSFVVLDTTPLPPSMMPPSMISYRLASLFSQWYQLAMDRCYNSVSCIFLFFYSVQQLTSLNLIT